MPDTNLTVDQIRALAADAGLERFTDEHLQQLTRATNASRARAKKLGSERLRYGDEPAHVYRIEEQAP